MDSRLRVGEVLTAAAAHTHRTPTCGRPNRACCLGHRELLRMVERCLFLPVPCGACAEFASSAIINAAYEYIYAELLSLFKKKAPASHSLAFAWPDGLRTEAAERSCRCPLIRRSIAPHTHSFVHAHAINQNNDSEDLMQNSLATKENPLKHHFFLNLSTRKFICKSLRTEGGHI